MTLQFDINALALLLSVGHQVGLSSVAKRLLPPPWAACAVVMSIAFAFGGGTYQRSWPDAVVQIASLPLLVWAIPQVRLRWSNEWVRGALLLAGAVVVVIPIIVVFLLLQRYIMQGIAMTGIK